MKRRVAITGVGVVTPAGNDVATMWKRLLEGRGCGAPIASFDARGFSTRIAAEVRDVESLPPPADRKLLKFASRSHRFALAAAGTFSPNDVIATIVIETAGDLSADFSQVTVGDRPTVAAAFAARLLGLPGNSPDGAKAARNKRLTRQRLRDAGMPRGIATTASLRATMRGLYQRPMRHNTRTATNAIEENQAMLGWPNGTMMAAASSGPIAVPRLPPTWKIDCAKP